MNLDRTIATRIYDHVSKTCKIYVARKQIHILHKNWYVMIQNDTDKELHDIVFEVVTKHTISASDVVRLELSKLLTLELVMWRDNKLCNIAVLNTSAGSRIVCDGLTYNHLKKHVFYKSNCLHDDFFVARSKMIRK